MFLKKLRNLYRTLALRLTFWYAGIFAMSTMLAFVLVYLMMATILQQRTDEDLEEDIIDCANLMRLGGFEKLKEEMAFETQGEEAHLVFYRLWSHGQLIMTTDLSSWQGLSEPETELLQMSGNDDSVFQTLMLPKRDYPVRSIYGAIGPDIVLQIGESLEENDEQLAVLRKGFIAVLLIIILLGGPIGWFMARRALRGVEKVTYTATKIAGGAFNQRVPVSTRNDELDQLAQTFNIMLDRIQALILGMREMTDNLAHDIRSPVARIQAAVEMALNSEAETDWVAMAIDTTEECNRLLEMINTTLDIAEAESGAARLKISEVDLVDIVVDACDLFQTVAEDKKITVATDLPLLCRIHGDLQRLQRVFSNLLDNAIKYMSPGGQVTIRLTDEGCMIKLSITDTGAGISSEEIPKIFQRFYRCDWSRSKYGNGLGLSLALAFVRAHGGDITVNSKLGEGSTFTVLLPRSLMPSTSALA